MKITEKHIFTFLFVAGIGLFSAISIMNTAKPLLDEVMSCKLENTNDITEAINDADTLMTENVAERYKLIETYGFVTRLLGKNEVNGFEYVRDKNGYLSLGNFWNEVYDTDEKALALNVEEFYEDLKKKNIEMMFVSFPQKVSDDWTDGYSGIPYDDYSYRTNMFMIQMRKYGITNIDMNKVLENSGLSYDEMFFKTDHHWTSKAAFYGFQAIVDKIEEMGIDIDPDNYYRNLDNYEQIHYDDMMLGSSGRSVGMTYAGGAEDFDLYYINSDKVYDYSIDDRGTMEGDISQTLIDFNIPESIKNNSENIYKRSLYDMYMRGISEIMSVAAIDNYGEEDDPRILMITDSYASPIATWLSPMCSRLDFLWASKNSAEEIEKYIEENDYDLVIVGLYPNDMNESFIHF